MATSPPLYLANKKYIAKVIGKNAKIKTYELNNT